MKTETSIEIPVDVQWEWNGDNVAVTAVNTNCTGTLVNILPHLTKSQIAMLEEDCFDDGITDWQQRRL